MPVVAPRAVAAMAAMTGLVVIICGSLDGNARSSSGGGLLPTASAAFVISEQRSPWSSPFLSNKNKNQVSRDDFFSTRLFDSEGDLDTPRSSSSRATTTTTTTKGTTTTPLRRLGLAGVSVSDGGFTVMWGLSSCSKTKSSSNNNNNDQDDDEENQPPQPSQNTELLYWPWAVTTPEAGDQTAATSAQALTLCQLIAGVDLAGSRLPPDILAQVAVLKCEQERDHHHHAEKFTTNENDDDNNAVTGKDDDDSSFLGLFGKVVDGSSLTSNLQDLTMDKVSGDVHRQLLAIQRQWFPKEAAAAAASSNDERLTYTDAPAWVRARVKLPLCTLDQIVVSPRKTKNGSSSSSSWSSISVSFHVQVRDYGSLVLKDVTDDVVADVLGPLYDGHTFDDATRLAYLTTALSLRYKAPVLLEHADGNNIVDNDTDEDVSADDDSLFVSDIQQAFPLYTTVQKVQTPSDRVVSRIKEGWKVHKLQAAYKIAIQKKDVEAMAKIRAKLDEMDAMDLPVQPDSELDSMQ